MKKAYTSRCLLIILIVLLALSSYSGYGLHKISLDEEYFQAWSDSSRRDQVLKDGDKLYIPIEALIFVLAGLAIYLTYKGWGEELTDGRILKVLAYFASTILAGLYSVYNYMILVQSKVSLANNGRVIYLTIIFKNLLIVLVLMGLALVFRRMILKDIKKEEEMTRETDYYDSWLDMTEKVEEVNKKS